MAIIIFLSSLNRDVRENDMLRVLFLLFVNSDVLVEILDFKSFCLELVLSVMASNENLIDIDSYFNIASLSDSLNLGIDFRSSINFTSDNTSLLNNWF